MIDLLRERPLTWRKHHVEQRRGASTTSYTAVFVHRRQHNHQHQQHSISSHSNEQPI